MGMGGVGEFSGQLMMMRWRLEAVERELSAARGKASKAELRAVAAEKLRQGASLTRQEAASYIGVSTKKLQRMEAKGELRRCPNLGTVVRYAARDVLRLASAS